MISFFEDSRPRILGLSASLLKSDRSEASADEIGAAIIKFERVFLFWRMIGFQVLDSRVIVPKSETSANYGAKPFELMLNCNDFYLQATPVLNKVG